MASALASPPPPWSFGSADLKANARKYLERALMISAIVHISAVLAFRATLERFAASEAEPPVILRPWDPTIFTPPIVLLPPEGRPASDVRSEDGILEPVDQVPPEVIDRLPGDVPDGPVATDLGGGSKTGSDDRLLPPPDPPKAPAFRHTESLPQPLHAPLPPYPDWMREAQIEGRVLMRVLVGKDGLPKRIVVAGGSKILGKEAEKTLRLWTFRPGLSNGQPAEVWLDIPVNYQLIR